MDSASTPHPVEGAASRSTSRCSRCKQSLPVDQFSKSNREASGLQPWCKGCRATYARTRTTNPKISLPEAPPSPMVVRPLDAPVSSKALPRAERIARDGALVREAWAFDVIGEAALREAFVDLDDRVRSVLDRENSKTRGPEQEAFRKIAKAFGVTPALQAFAKADARYWGVVLAQGKLTHHLAKKYTRMSRTVPFDEQLVILQHGLYRAALRWTPDNDVLFTTYAAHWARASMQRAAERHGPVMLPTHESTRLGGWTTTLGISLDAPLSGEDARTLHDTFSDEDQDSPVNELDQEGLLSVLREEIARLPGRQREIVEYAIQHPDCILREMGAEFNLSRERVRQIHAAAVVDLRARLSCRLDRFTMAELTGTMVLPPEDEDEGPDLAPPPVSPPRKVRRSSRRLDRFTGAEGTETEGPPLEDEADGALDRVVLPPSPPPRAVRSLSVRDRGRVELLNAWGLSGPLEPMWDRGVIALLSRLQTIALSGRAAVTDWDEVLAPENPEIEAALQCAVGILPYAEQKYVQVRLTDRTATLQQIVASVPSRASEGKTLRLYQAGVAKVETRLAEWMGAEAAAACVRDRFTLDDLPVADVLDVLAAEAWSALEDGRIPDGERVIAIDRDDEIRRCVEALRPTRLWGLAAVTDWEVCIPLPSLSLSDLPASTTPTPSRVTARSMDTLSERLASIASDLHRGLRTAPPVSVPVSALPLPTVVPPVPVSVPVSALPLPSSSSTVSGAGLTPSLVDVRIVSHPVSPVDFFELSRQLGDAAARRTAAEAKLLAAQTALDAAREELEDATHQIAEVHLALGRALAAG